MEINKSFEFEAESEVTGEIVYPDFPLRRVGEDLLNTEEEYVEEENEVEVNINDYPSIEDYNDVETLGSWNEAKARGENMDAYLELVHKQSRDNARTPMQWDKSKNAGFSSGNPWLKVNPNHTSINVEAQSKDPDSILSFYKTMIV